MLFTFYGLCIMRVGTYNYCAYTIIANTIIAYTKRMTNIAECEALILKGVRLSRKLFHRKFRLEFQ